MAKNEQMVWTDSLSVGNTRLDGQHRSLIRLINHFGKDKLTTAQMADKLNGLITYAAKHFNFEETIIMRRAPDILNHHTDCHAQFIEQAYGFVQRFNEGSGEDLRADVYDFLCQWLLKHIQVEDQQYNRSKLH